MTPESQKKLIRLLRYSGIIEGISFLILLLIAMPLKYVFHRPGFVLFFGWVHGALFITYGFLVIKIWIVRKWKFKRAFRAGIAAIIPLGTFFFDKELKKEEAEI
jgi:integral membrane protein